MPSFRDHLAALWAGVPASVAEDARNAHIAATVAESNRIRETAKASEAAAAYARQVQEHIGWWGQAVGNPADRFGGAYTADGWRRLGPVGDKDPRKGGRDSPVYWTETEILFYREASRFLDRWNDFYGGILNGLVNYTVGKGGFAWQACRRGQAKQAAPSSGVDVPADVRDLQLAFDGFRDRNRWRSRQRGIVRRAHRDGDVFVRLFRGTADRSPKARWVEPEHVVTPPGQSADGCWSFGILSDPADIETRLGIYVADPSRPGCGVAVRLAGADPEQFADLCDAAGVEAGPGVAVHLAMNVDDTVKRGVPTLVASQEGLEAARKLVRDITSTASFQAKIGLIRSHTGGTLASMTDFQLRQTGGATIPGLPAPGATGGPQYRPVPVTADQPGTRVIDASETINYLPGPVSGGVPNFLAAEQAQLRAAGVRVQMPEFMVTGDASNGNYASTKEAGSPFVTAREADQADFCDFERDIAREVVRLTCESGEVQANWKAMDAEVIAPPVAMKSDLEAEQVRGLKLQNKTLSPQEAIQQDGRDPKHVIADLKAWQEEFPDAAAPLGDEPAAGDGTLADVASQFAPPSAVSEDKTDKDGHKHGGDGKFVGKGGGKPGKAKSAPAAKPKAASSPKPAARVPEKNPSEKAARAMAAAVRVDKSVQRYAEEYNEPRFARVMGGVSFPDSEPVDVVLPDKSGKVAHGVEMKTMVVGEDDKLTMNAYAQVRKKEWERAKKATFHTVVSDDRAVFNAKGDGKHDETKRVYYYRRGIAGSARVGTMHRCKDEAELKALMAMPDAKLPPAAQRKEKDWLTQGEWVPLETERGYRNTVTGQEVRPKK